MVANCINEILLHAQLLSCSFGIFWQAFYRVYTNSCTMNLDIHSFVLGRTGVFYTAPAVLFVLINFTIQELEM